MRVLMLGVMFAVAALMPAAANADDQQIADFIKARLVQEKQQGNLYGFNVDMRVDKGTVWFKGFVSNRGQELMILRTAQLAGHLGVVQVVDDIEVNEGVAATQPAQARQPYAPTQQQYAPAQQQYAPAQQQYAPAQQQYAPAQQQPLPPQRYAARPDVYAQPQLPPGYTPPTQQTSPRYAQPGTNLNRQPAAGPTATYPRPQAGPAVPTPRQPYAAPTRSAGVPLSEKKAPAKDENTKVVTYQEPISQIPTPVYNSLQPQIPAAFPSYQGSGARSLPGQAASYAAGQPAAIAPPAPIAATPVAGPPLPFARAAAPQGCFDGSCGASGGFGGAPVPAQGFGGGPGGINSGNAALPGYAWPSYAAHPNYGAVSYPKQYSASAWPYIGPFYPYPQVPLGWRKVSLEWDDGWWFLDFNDRD